MIIAPLSFPTATMDLLSQSDGDNSQDDVESEAPKKSNSAAYEMVPLEADFEPTSLDVICARGKEGEWLVCHMLCVMLCGDMLSCHVIAVPNQLSLPSFFPASPTAYNHPGKSRPPH